jgi:VIT1/CCC1 family predicted Fe2+/Mn2+ transporter
MFIVAQPYPQDDRLMKVEAETTRESVLDPMDRVSEILFGLIMVLTFTGALSVAEAGEAGVRTMLIGALGCNFAWGVIDAIMYLMACLAEHGSRHRIVRNIQRTGDIAQARQHIRRELPPLVSTELEDRVIDTVREAILAMPEPPERPRLDYDDFRGAIAVFLLVFCSTLPVALPFLFFSDAQTALRVSNAVAILMLFALGYQYGRLAGHRPILMAVAMVVLGVFLVGIAMALGG